MVFTGLVQALGHAVFNSTTKKLHILANQENFWDEVVTGDSIAVNGVCLTLLESTNEIGVFFVMEETTLRTNIPNLAKTTTDNVGILLRNPDASSRVNLEKALKVGDHLGGHIVSGHVNGVAVINKIIPHNDGSRCFWIDLKSIDDGLFVRHKGSISFDGVSLTIAEIKNTKIRVSLTPYSLNHTTFQHFRIGDTVNVEFDSGDDRYKDREAYNGLEANKKISEILLPEYLNSHDEEMMQNAIELGECGRATGAPNPWVGCVITDTCENIIGKGYHEKAGQNHAEVNAIQDAKASGHEDKLQGGTCYTTLEPCCHFGRTGPCDQLLIQHEIGRVVIGLVDPDKQVSGTGVKNLLEAGIHVTTGTLESKIRESLRPYIHHRSTGIPWVVLKFGASLDGKINAPDGIPKFIITGKESHSDFHKRFRAMSQAIIIGSNTAEFDNPCLTVREFPTGCNTTHFRQPIRVAVGSRPFTLGSNMLDTKQAPTILCTTSELPFNNELFNSHGVEVLTLDAVDGHVNFRSLLLELGKRGVLQVLVEGGALFGSSLLEQGFVNQLVIYQAPIFLGKTAPSWSQVDTNQILLTQKLWKLENASIHGDDICAEYVFLG